MAALPLLLIACARLAACLGLGVRGRAAAAAPPARGPGEALARRHARATLPGLGDVAKADPGSLVAHRDACTGCDATVNLRCDGMTTGRYAPFHRIVDCLLPMYGMIRLARTASSNESAHVCALTWLRKDGMDLSFFLKEMVGIKWHALVDELDECASALPYHGYYRAPGQGATQQWMDNIVNDENLVLAYNIDVPRNLEWMQRDVLAFVGTRQPLFVLIQREERSRQFHTEGLHKLRDSMAAIRLLQGKPLEHLIYRGHETISATVNLFSRAAVVLGYHGAAFANSLFNSNRHCVHQISTTKDLNGEQQWRVNSEVNMNAASKLNVYNVSLARLLVDNNVTLGRFLQESNKDHFIKDLPFVPLEDSDVTSLQSGVRRCLDDWVEGHWHS